MKREFLPPLGRWGVWIKHRFPNSLDDYKLGGFKKTFLRTCI